MTKIIRLIVVVLTALLKNQSMPIKEYIYLSEKIDEIREEASRLEDDGK